MTVRASSLNKAPTYIDSRDFRARAVKPSISRVAVVSRIRPRRVVP